MFFVVAPDNVMKAMIVLPPLHATRACCHDWRGRVWRMAVDSNLWMGCRTR